MKLRYLYILVSFLISINVDTDDIYDNSWALIVGINNYQLIEDLSYSVDDAISIKNMLWVVVHKVNERIGFDDFCAHLRWSSKSWIFHAPRHVNVWL